MFPKGELRGWQYIDRHEFPHDMYTLNGEKLTFGQETKGIKRLPKILRKRTLTGDMIPSTSWGSSLANLLTKKSWDSLRHPIIERNHGTCEYCGDYVGPSLEIHELWGYSQPPSDDFLANLDEGQTYFGRQTLEGLAGVCKSCHACFHLGLANVQGRLDRVLYRMSQINGWSEAQMEEYLRAVSNRHEWLSEIYWSLDLSWLHGRGVEGLIVSSSWKPIAEEPRILMRKGASYGDSVAIVTGFPWRYPKETEWRVIDPR